MKHCQSGLLVLLFTVVALFAKYFQKDKSAFSQCTIQLIYTTFDKLFILFLSQIIQFLGNIDGYYIWLSSNWTI